jgi:sulfate adenylyltransferase subunit 1
MDLLRITTAGSVDDGKSTLIGRLLYDTNSIAEDKKQTIYETSIRRGGEEIDFSLFTDGLIAERAQGITIDVAHIYFSTPKRKFIIADTPGHIEYTRNMLTGASNSQVAIVLIDARLGVVEQTKRHLYLLKLIQVQHIFLAVNKMDLVNYKESVFNTLVEDLEKVAAKFAIQKNQMSSFPCSAKKGDNVCVSSENMPWYQGPNLLEALENFSIASTNTSNHALFNVQTVIRPKGEKWIDYRAYAGKVNQGSFSVGDTVQVFPSNKTSTIKQITYNKQNTESADEGQSISLCLEDDIDVSRGEWIFPVTNILKESNAFSAVICWLNDRVNAHEGNKFILQYGTTLVKAKLEKIELELDLSSLEFSKAKGEIGLNDIVLAHFKTAQATLLHAQQGNYSLGRFILIDEQTNHTVAIGMMK